jgi:peptidoglycan/xylan/chitin deacetylase (PgdA/CDA1 family)
VLPQSYLLNACQVLKQRWDPQGSPPGTVVVPVMYHSIAHDGRTISDPKDISATEFADFVQHAQFLGFETITTAQLWDFLSNNALIPPRSMILIVDDRRPGVITEHFLPILEANDWTVTAAYISDPNSFEWAWDEMLALYATGRLDVQSHGYTGTVYINAQTTEAEIRQEIVDSVSVLEERFGQRPLAFVWPGGNFNSLAVQIAREAGYQLGFTAYSRGPLLFNWIPQGEPERLVGDPLLTLPRAWSNSASFNLDQAIQIGDQARLYAEQNYPFEAAWYARWCSGSLPEP